MLAIVALELFEQFGFFLELLLPVLLFLALEALLLGQLLGRPDLVAPLVQKILPHFLLALRHLVLEFLVALLVPLTTVGIVTETGAGHRGRDVLDFLYSDRGDRVMREFHLFYNRISRTEAEVAAGVRM